MGKAARTRRAEQRKKQKRARKEQERAKYKSYQEAGTNKKSKRNVLNAKRKHGVKLAKHSVGNCGNVGCSRVGCFPHLAAPKMSDNNDPRARFIVRKDQKINAET